MKSLTVAYSQMMQLSLFTWPQQMLKLYRCNVIIWPTEHLNDCAAAKLGEPCLVNGTNFYSHTSSEVWVEQVLQEWYHKQHHHILNARHHICMSCIYHCKNWLFQPSLG